jgi:Rieske 2Fe-2S family protein
MTSISLPPSLIQTLPGRLYTDPEVFALEQARIFESMWFAVARSSDLSEPGKFVTKQVGTENVIVLRGRDGVLRAFLNVCRHRGARLCDAEAGQLRRNIQCMYHAWTYGLDGELVAAPNLTKMQDIDRSEFGLINVHLREWLGYAWVCLADEPPSFEDEVIASADERLGGSNVIGGWQVDDLAVGRRISYDVKANWKLIIENFQECYHCATIHPELTEMLPEFADGYATQTFVGHGAVFAEDALGFTVDRSEGQEQIPGVDAEHDRRYYAITVKPQALINLVPDHVIFLRLYPIAVDRTLVECDWLYLPGVVESQADLSRSVELFDRVNRQDFDACEATQPGMSSRAYHRGGVLVPSEHHITAFHAWVESKLA